CGDFKKSPADAGMEVVWQAFVAGLVALPRGRAGESGLHRQVEDDREIGPEGAGGDRAKLLENLPLEAMAVTPTGQRGIGNAVAHHPLPAPEGRPHGGAQMLATRREVQQRLGGSVPPLDRPLDQQLADHLRTGRAAGLAGRDDTLAVALEPALETRD